MVILSVESSTCCVLGCAGHCKCSRWELIHSPWQPFLVRKLRSRKVEVSSPCVTAVWQQQRWAVNPGRHRDSRTCPLYHFALLLSPVGGLEYFPFPEVNCKGVYREILFHHVPFSYKSLKSQVFFQNKVKLSKVVMIIHVSPVVITVQSKNLCL